MKRIAVAIGILISAFICSCNKTDIPQNEPNDKAYEPITLTKVENDMIEGINDFGFDIFHQQFETGQDHLISPLSAAVALSMAAEGAAGATKDQILSTLGIKDKSEDAIGTFYLKILEAILNTDSNVTLGIANSLWYDTGFSLSPAYITRMEDVFSATSHIEDFSNPSVALNTINNWCAEQTDNKITRFLDEISPDSRLILLNALYYKGSWTDGFEKPAQGKFTHDDGSISTEWMISDRRKVRYSETEDYKCIEIPYGNGSFAMDLILPLETDDENPWASFTNDKWTDLATNFSEETLPIKFPCFKIEGKNDLTETLSALGIRNALSPALADFSGMSDMNIYLQKVKQAVYVNVDEKGTEAAGVTGNELLGALPGNENSLPKFIADRPFMFMIRETASGLILFVGYRS